MLSENRKLIKDERKILSSLNNFSINLVLNLGIKTEHNFLNTTYIFLDRIENVIQKYGNHASVINIKNI